MRETNHAIRKTITNYNERQSKIPCFLILRTKEIILLWFCVVCSLGILRAKDLRFGLLENRRLLSRDIRQKMIFRPFFLIIFETTTLEVTLNLMELYTVADNDYFDAKRFPVYFGRIRSCTMALRTKSWACDCVTRPPVFF
jgi:hypothetical protein